MAYTINGIVLQAAKVKVPRWGIWTARVKLAADKVLPKGSAVTVILGDLTLSGTVRQDGVFQSSAEYVIIGGKDGWAGTVTKRHYRSDAGVKLSQVAIDLGNEARETVVILPGADTSLGYGPTRAAGGAAEALDALGARWAVGSDGKTYIGERVDAPLSTAVKWTVESYEPANKVAVIGLATDALAAFWPGVQVKGNGLDFTIGSMIATVTDRRVALELWGL